MWRTNCCSTNFPAWSFTYACDSIPYLLALTYQPNSQPNNLLFFFFSLTDNHFTFTSKPGLFPRRNTRINIPRFWQLCKRMGDDTSVARKFIFSPRGVKCRNMWKSRSILVRNSVNQTEVCEFLVPVRKFRSFKYLNFIQGQQAARNATFEIIFLYVFVTVRFIRFEKKSFCSVLHFSLLCRSYKESICISFSRLFIHFLLQFSINYTHTISTERKKLSASQLLELQLLSTVASFDKERSPKGAKH